MKHPTDEEIEKYCEKVVSKMRNSPQRESTWFTANDAAKWVRDQQPNHMGTLIEMIKGDLKDAIEQTENSDNQFHEGREYALQYVLSMIKKITASNSPKPTTRNE